MLEKSKKIVLLIAVILIVGIVNTIDAATFIVNQTGGGSDGTCDATCTLRDAVTAASNFPSNDVIEFSATLNGQTIELGGHRMNIENNGSLQINGLGVNLLTISGSNVSRVFHLLPGANATISGLTITNGNGAGGTVVGSSFSGGGAILVDNATLNLINTAVINNIDGGSGGGGLFAINSTIEINNSNISNNSQPTRSGGGIYLRDSNSFILNSTFSNNSADENGGGLYLQGGSSTITNSTIKNNTATTSGGIEINASSVEINDTTIHSNTVHADGGGINTNNQSVQSTTITNSTISGNSATNGDGGGIYNTGELVLENTTVNNNSAGSSGGGLFHLYGVIKIRNTIIANSTSGGDCFRNTFVPPGGSNQIDAEFSLIQGGLTCVNGTNSSNRTGNPLLGPLQNNGGPTLTHEPSPTSQVIDAGSNGLVSVSNDQRGFNRTIDGDNNGSGIVDIGSVEYAQTTFVVTKTADTLDGSCNADCSLREAIAVTNANGVPSTIEFASPLFDSPQMITLQGLELSIANSGSLTINGKGADKLTISGQNASRVFHVEMNATATINGLTIRDGNGVSSTADGNGGGVLSFGTLNLSNSTVRNNTASEDGGGINNANGVLVVTNSTINNNLTTEDGGGIHDSGFLTIINSTIGENSATGSGGGIHNANETATITNATISNNTAATGGGVVNAGTSLSLTNTIVANSTAGGDCSRQNGSISSEYSLIEDGLTCVNGTNSNNLTGDPLLFPLDIYGGTTQTYAPSINSPVLDKGKAVDVLFAGLGKANLLNQFAPLTNDQRGMQRPQDIFFVANAPGGNGSDLGAFEAIAPTATSASISGKVLSTNGVSGVANAIVQITTPSGNVLKARTNHFGYYKFNNIEVGQTLVIDIFSRSYQYESQVINFDESLTELHFLPNINKALNGKILTKPSFSSEK